MRFNELVCPPGERIADAAHRVMRRAIVRHELAPGFHLSVPALAGQFGISRSPVHEAVKRLVQEGLATEEPRRGAFVTVYSAPALMPLYEVRSALEGLAASLAAERASTETISRLASTLEEEADAIARDQMERHIDVDIQFHQLVLSAAANPALEEMLGQIYQRIRNAMVSRVIPTGPAQALSDHQAILKAIRARDPAGAHRAATGHVMRVYGKLAARRTEALGVPSSAGV
jgi:DNA-binding GntR family transcriptional regulator